MAVDYSEYARIYGGGSGGVNQSAGGVGAGIGRGFQAIPNVMDRLAQSQGEGLDDAFAPLLGLLSKKVDEWGDIDKIPSAGEAYMAWTNERNMSPRQKRIARRKGILNPIAFKQQYDAQMEMYLPAIKQKLEAFRTMGNKTDKNMREFLSTKPGLNQFFLANTSPEELALNPYFKPERSWAQWAEGAGGPLGIGMKAGGATLAGVHGGSMIANKMARSGAAHGLSPKDMTNLIKGAEEGGFGSKQIGLDKARKTSSISKSQKALQKAQKKYTKAKRYYENITWC